jgi:hypothetical protein
VFPKTTDPEDHGKVLIEQKMKNLEQGTRTGQRAFSLRF